MAGKGKKEGQPIKGQLVLNSNDVRGSRFSIEGAPEVISRHIIEFAPGVLPSNYEPELYDVSGEIEIKVTVTKKK